MMNENEKRKATEVFTDGLFVIVCVTIVALIFIEAMDLVNGLPPLPVMVGILVTMTVLGTACLVSDKFAHFLGGFIFGVFAFGFMGSFFVVFLQDDFEKIAGRKVSYLLLAATIALNALILVALGLPSFFFGLIVFFELELSILLSRPRRPQKNNY